MAYPKDVDPSIRSIIAKSIETMNSTEVPFEEKVKRILNVPLSDLNPGAGFDLLPYVGRGDSPLLSKGWGLLSSEVSRSKPGALPAERGIKAFFLADALIKEAQERKPEIAVLSNGSRSGRKRANRIKRDLERSTELLIDPESPFGKLSTQVVDFKDNLEAAGQNVDSSRKVRESVRFMDALYAVKDSPIFSYWENNSNSSSREWLTMYQTDLKIRTGLSPHTRSLFNSDELQGIDTSLVTYLWMTAIVKEDTQQATGLLDYFLKNKKMSNYFWDTLTKADIVYPLPTGTPNPTVGSMEYFFTAGEARGRVMLDTLPFEDYDSSQKQVMLTNLIGACAQLQVITPENENLEILRNFIATKGKDLTGNVSSETAIGILTNALPGFIGVDVLGGHTRIYTPKPGQTVDQLKASLGGGIDVLYTSSAEEKQIKQEIEDKRFVVEDKKSEFSGVYGQVEVPDAAELPGIVSHLSGEFVRSNPRVTVQAATQVLDSFKDRARSNESAIVIPGILPKTHPLSTLWDVGIVAVQQKGEEAEVVIDPQKAKIKAEAGEKIMVRVPAVEGNVDTSFSILVNAAVAFSKMNFIPETLDRSSVSDARTTVKTWNTIAKQKGFPQIEIVPAGSEAKIRALTVVGKKPEFVNVIPPKQ